MDEFAQAVKRHERRRKVFVEHGLSEDEAWNLAETMYDRDRLGDTRRLCFECAHFRGGLCAQLRDSKGRMLPALTKFILATCEYFELKGAK